MADRSGVDHAEAQAAGDTPVDPVGPVGEIAGQPQDLAGVADGGLRARAEPSATSVALEERDAESSLEFGEALRQRRRAHADPLGGDRPRRRVGDGDEILELANREIGKRSHPAKYTSVLLHNPVPK